MIVDTHVHIWAIDPPRYPVGPTAPNWTALPDEPATAEELIADMDANGVGKSVLVQTSWSTWDNGYIADSVKAYPDRFIGHGLLDPLDVDNATLARYWVRDRGLAGFRFHPLYYPAENVLLRRQNEPLWEEIAALDVVVQFHMRAEHVDQVAALAVRYPHLRMIIDHMGYPNVADPMSAFTQVVGLAHHTNIYLKLSDIKGRSREAYPYLDVHPFIRQLLDAFGVQRTVWGTGYPGHHRQKHGWLTLAEELQLVRDGLGFLTYEEIDRILGGTALELWRLA
jgi:predicted TIM-barrel fold metal-dependent hydrolase